VRSAIRIAAVIFALAYPLAVYVGLTRLGTRHAAWLLLALAILHTIWRSRERRRLAWGSALAVPLCASALWLDDQRYVLAMPVFMNGALFASFFASLRSETPLVERFARLRVQDLSAAEVRYCRSVTKLWCGFFVINGASAGALALFGSLQAWTLYTGLISYVLMAALGVSEYSVRKYRFGRYGSGLHDRVLRALLPARSTPP
jgi:uncharacterized membrane protein